MLKNSSDACCLRSGFAVLSVFVLSMSVFIVNIQHRSLWFDEIFSLNLVSNSWGDFWSIVVRREFNMMLYVVLLKLWVGVIGNGEVAVRMLSVLFCSSATTVFFVLLKKYLPMMCCYCACVLLTTNTLVLRYAQEVRSYSLFLFLSIMSAYCLFLLMDEFRLSRVVAYVVALSASMYSHFFTVYLVLCYTLVVLLLWPKRFVGYVVATFTFLIITIPCFWYILFNGGNVGWIAKPHVIDLYCLSKALLNNSLYVYTVSVCLSMCAVACVLDRGARRLLSAENVKFIVSTVIVVILFPVAVFCVSQIKPMFIDKYFIVLIPFVTVLVVVGLRCSNRVSRISFVTVLSVSVAFSLYTFWSSPEKIGEDWKHATGYMLNACKPKDVFVFYSWSSKVAFDYYYIKENGSEQCSTHTMVVDGDEQFEKLFSVLSENSRVWLVTRNPYQTKNGYRKLREFLSSRLGVESVHNFHAIYISLFAQK